VLAHVSGSCCNGLNHCVLHVGFDFAFVCKACIIFRMLRDVVGVWVAHLTFDFLRSAKAQSHGGHFPFDPCVAVDSLQGR
jgi:hypothetical protein